MVQEFGAGIFAQVDDLFKLPCAAIIRVGDVVEVRMLCQVVGQQLHPLHGLRVGSHGPQAAQVVGIHGQDVVEVGKVAIRDGARAVRESIATAIGMIAHARIGQLPLVVVDEARRVNVKVGTAASGSHLLSKHLFGQRRTTDVA